MKGGGLMLYSFKGGWEGLCVLVGKGSWAGFSDIGYGVGGFVCVIKFFFCYETVFFYIYLNIVEHCYLQKCLNQMLNKIHNCKMYRLIKNKICNMVKNSYLKYKWNSIMCSFLFRKSIRKNTGLHSQSGMFFKVFHKIPHSIFYKDFWLSIKNTTKISQLFYEVMWYFSGENMW